MSAIESSRRVCPRSAGTAPIGRRGFVQAGVLGFMGLTLGDQLRAIAAGTAECKGKSVILIWLDGGPSQLEIYDPKPDAPREYRGPFGVDPTRTCRASSISEMLAAAGPACRQDGLRPLGASRHGRPLRRGSLDADRPLRLDHASTCRRSIPSVGSYVSRVRGPNQPGCRPMSACPRRRASTCSPATRGRRISARRTTRSTSTPKRSTCITRYNVRRRHAASAWTV